MHLFFIIVLSLLAIILLALWWPVRLDVQAQLDMPRRAQVTLLIRFFSGLVRLRYKLEANLLSEPSLTLLLYQGEEAPRVLWRPGQSRPRTQRMGLPFRKIWRHVRLKRLWLLGELGIRDDAFWTVIFTGTLCAALQSLLVAACADKEQSALDVRVLPDFTGDRLRLNLEGIADCPPIHIISAIMIWHLKNRKGQATVWHILSKTS